MCVQNKALRALTTQLPIITINTNIHTTKLYYIHRFKKAFVVQCSIREIRFF